MRLRKFVDSLPIPRVLQPKRKGGVGTYYEVRMKQVKQKLHRDLKPTTVWGYNGSYPGPTFEVRSGERVRVKWINELPKKHLLPVDKTVHGAGPGNSEVRTVVHLHGSRVQSDSDGLPDDWFTKGFRKTGPSFTRKIYRYPNRQPATTLWYHDHTLGITRLNVYAGLAGFYLIRDQQEDSLNLPKGKFEIPLVIQDRSFNQNGSLFYPRQSQPPVSGVNPSIVPEFFGDTLLVNGKVWPFLDVEPRKYRFRILNGSNARFYRMSFSSGQSFFQVGSDQGLLERPVKLRTLLLGPGERADVIVDFTHHKGKRIILKNNAPTPFPDGDPVNPNTTGQIMQFRVKRQSTSRDTSCIPSRLSVIQRLSPASAKVTRYLTLDESRDRFGRLLLLLDNKRFTAPISEKPRLGTTEIWRMINVTPDTHSMHLHLVKFQVLGRRPFNVNHFKKTGKIRYTGPRIPADPNERGWKDTISTNPGEVTSIIARFSPFTGRYVWHCHLLEHEDNQMMRPYLVVPKRRFIRRL